MSPAMPLNGSRIAMRMREPTGARLGVASRERRTSTVRRADAGIEDHDFCRAIDAAARDEAAQYRERGAALGRSIDSGRVRKLGGAGANLLFACRCRRS